MWRSAFRELFNKDETAPIFETANYANAADLFAVVPAFVEEFKRLMAPSLPTTPNR
jgi:hypothetical protein